MARGYDSESGCANARVFADLSPYSGGRSAKTEVGRGIEARVRYPPEIPGNPQVVPLYFHIGTRRYFSQPKAEAGKAAEGRSRKAEARSGGRKKLCGQDLSRSGGVERHRSKRSESDRL